MNHPNNQPVALIYGGLSIESEISTLTMENIKKAFEDMDIPFVLIPADQNIFEKLIQTKPKKAFLATHGPYGEDGTLQGILEYLKIPYTGSGVLASALCMDKIQLKKLLIAYNIPTPSFMSVMRNRVGDFDVDCSYLGSHASSHQKSMPLEHVLSAPPFTPCVVKSCRSGSSIGVIICQSKEDWSKAIHEALKVDSQILIEKYIQGQEVVVPWLDGKTLTPVEIKTPQDEFYDFHNKYKSQNTQYIVPPNIHQNIIKKIQEITLEIGRLCHIRSYGRADFIIDNNEQIYFVEFNTLPGMTSRSLVPKSAKHDNISYNDLIKMILDQASLDYIQNSK